MTGMSLDSPPSNRKVAVVIFLLAATLVATLDLWTKHAAFQFLQVEEGIRMVGEPGAAEPRPAVKSQMRYVVIENFFWLEANYNYGAYRGWFAGNTRALAWLSAVASMVILLFFIWHLRTEPRAELSFVLALGLLLGGTIGNLYDRALLLGVRDWIRWFVVIDGKEHVWPNFNIADSAICTGVGLVLVREFIRWRMEVRASKA